MAKFYLPVTWEECSVAEVEAENLEEAIEYFNEHSDEIDTPNEKHYVDGSFCLSTTEVEELRLVPEQEKNLRDKIEK